MGEVVEGRPKGSGTKAEKIKSWRLANPNGKKIDVIERLVLQDQQSIMVE